MLHVTQRMHVSPTILPPIVNKENLWAKPLYMMVQAVSRVYFNSLTGCVLVVTSLMRTALLIYVVLSEGKHMITLETVECLPMVECMLR